MNSRKSLLFNLNAENPRSILFLISFFGKGSNIIKQQTVSMVRISLFLFSFFFFFIFYFYFLVYAGIYIGHECHPWSNDI